MFFTILRCVGEAVGHKGLAALAASAIPFFGGFLYEIAEEALERYRRRRKLEQFRQDMEALVQAEMAEIRQQAQQIAAEVVPPGTPPQQQKQLELYLTMVPLAARQTFRRPDDPQGRSVPPQLDLTRPENFLQILPPRPPRFEIGQRVPGALQWELVQPLGVGGFGEVWLGRHTFLGEQRAFKFCLEPRYQERLLRHEGEVVRRVMGMKDRFPADRHGIVWLLDAYLEGETPWLAYEYVEGGDLGGVIQKLKGVEAPQRGRYAMEYLQALAWIVGEFHALEPPLVHRDLKPANILLRRTPKGVVLRVTDFGISQLAAEHAVEQTRVQSRWVTQCSMVRGAYTPLYASPQQKRGERADPRDDVYSLGVIGWQMVCGDAAAERPTRRRLQREVERCQLPTGIIDILERSWEDEAGERLAGGRELWRQLREALGTGGSAERSVSVPAVPAVFQGRLVHTLAGHKGEVYGVAVSGDGRVVVSRGWDGVVCVWDGGSGQLRHRLEGHKDWVWDVAVSGDGGVVVSGGADGVVYVWDGVSGELRHRLEGHEGEMVSLAESGDGGVLVSRGWDGVVHVWDVVSGELPHWLKGHRVLVNGVAVSGDGGVVVSGGADGVVCVWDGGSGQLRHRLAGHKGGVWGVAVSGNGRVVVSGDMDGVVCVWDGGSGQLRQRLEGHKDWVSGVAVSGDGGVVVSGDMDGVVCVWDGGSGQLRHRLEGHRGGVNGVAVSGDGRVVVSGGEDGVVCVWDGVSGELRHRLAGHKGEVRGVAVSGDGGVVVSGGEDGVVRVWK